MKDTTYIENLYAEVKAMMKPFEKEKAKLEAQKEAALAKMNEISPDSTNLEELKALSVASGEALVIDQALKNLEKLTRQAVTNFDLQAKLEYKTNFSAGDACVEKAELLAEEFVEKINLIEKEAAQEVAELYGVARPICEYLGGVVADYQLDPIKRSWGDESIEREWRSGNVDVYQYFNKAQTMRSIINALGFKL